MARPTKLTKALIDQAEDYAQNWKHIDGGVIPSIEGLTLHLKLARSTVYAWCDTPTQHDDETPQAYAKRCDLHEQFSDIVETVLVKQSRTLINHGLDNQFNSTIAKLMLSGKHGYVEKSEVDQNLKGDVTFINDVPRPKAGDGSGQGS